MNDISETLSQASIEAIEALIKSGAIRGYVCTPSKNTGKTSESRGKGKAIAWLCSHVAYDGDECLTWPYNKDRGRPTTVGYNGKIYKPLRLMCALAHGAPPSDKHEAAYTCYGMRKGCINPRHLAWKTKGQNMFDQFQSGVRTAPGRGGKLLADEVAEIRAAGDSVPRAVLAERFGLCPQRIGDIQKGLAYARPPKAWALRSGKYYARVAQKGKFHHLGSFTTEKQAMVAYNAARLQLRRGEPIVRDIIIPKRVALKRFYTMPTLGFGDGADFGRRIPIIGAAQEESSFELYDAIEKLPAQSRDFVLAVLDCENLNEAASRVGLDAAAVSAILPSLKDYLLPYLR